MNTSPFKTALQEYIYLDKYSRFNYDLGRREQWTETVDRTVSHLRGLANDADFIDWDEIHNSIFNLDVMPSMRNLAMAGAAAERSSIVSYNCSYAPVADILSFREAVVILMSGSGLGYSVENRYIENLPPVQVKKDQTIQYTVEDTSDGWATAVHLTIESLLDGVDVDIDYSMIRAAGTPLRVKGGRASGPEHLEKGIEAIKQVIGKRTGEKLRSLDIHDIMCHIAQAIVSGGVRRCLPSGTRVHTQRGSVPIQDVVVGDMVMTAVGYKPVTGFMNQGRQKLVDLVTESGTIFSCTPNHRIAILSDVWGNYEFKQAKDISADDRILFITNEIEGGNDDNLIPLPSKRDADRSGSLILQPKLTTETAWFIGKFLADGYVSVGSLDERGKGGNCAFSIASHEDESEQIERIQEWMTNHGLSYAEHSGDDERCIKLRSRNRQIARWMYNYKQPSTTLKIPDPIWTASKEIRASFLAGIIDGDGSLVTRPVNVVSTVYESFGREIVKLLSTLGIVSEIRLARKAKGNWQDLWRVTIKDGLALKKAESVLGIFSTKKWIQRSGKQNGYTVPASFVKRDIKYKDRRNIWSPRGDHGMNSATLTEMIDATHYVPIRVVEIRDGDYEQTYDLEVRDGNTFVAEGYLVHNSAMIALFDYDDELMRNCKDGDKMVGNSQRWLSNNSVVIEREMTFEDVDAIMRDMAKDGSGEPGLFSRHVANKTKPYRRDSCDFGLNPCSEIMLRPYQFCNLSSIVCRPDDTLSKLLSKTRIATTIGTIQSLATNFPSLRPEWKINAEKERLLGVDLNGIMDSELARSPETLKTLKNYAILINKILAEKLGINQAAAITCVKPSGNSSVLLDTSAGLHTRWNDYYIRRVSTDATNPLMQLMIDSGVPVEKRIGSDDTFVVSFPVKAPNGAITRKDLSAIEQCEVWKNLKVNYTEHNPSVTITYNEDELDEMILWVFRNQAVISGMAFLPSFDAQYEQMPYEDIDKKTYQVLARAIPKVDFSRLAYYEKGIDTTNVSTTFACTSDKCIMPTL